MSYIDAISIASTAKNVIFKTYTPVSTDKDIEYVKALGDIINSILIISIAVFLCVFLNFVYKFLIFLKKQGREVAREREEMQAQKEKIAHDDKWRDIEHAWKMEYDKDWKEKDQAYELEKKRIELKIKEVGQQCKEAEINMKGEHSQEKKK